MGLSLVYSPELFKIPEGKIVKKVAAGKDSFGVVTIKNNHKYLFNLY